jgi:hypothetical protein
MWDCRQLIRRGGGLWPRNWREPGRLSRHRSGGRTEAEERKPKDGGGEKPDEHRLESPWQPPKDSADRWKD